MTIFIYKNKLITNFVFTLKFISGDKIRFLYFMLTEALVSKIQALNKQNFKN